MIHKRIAFLCMLLPCTLWGQTDRTSPTGRIEFLPPEAASLMRYVDYPVSHLTGVPDIRIPLHTVQIGKISLPLTLMFHTDNYSRPNQLAGSVGKGWSLSTELQITRQVNGLDDLNPSTLTPGYYYASDIPTDYREGDAVQRSELNAKELYYGRRDEEPDRFYYRLLDKSGAFYFRHRPDGSVEAVPVPYDGVKIEYGSDRRFTVWDTDGTKYVFSLAATDTEQPISGGMDDNIVIAWKCESIYSPQGEQEVSFTYTDDYPRFVTTYNDRIEIYDRAQGLVTPDLIKEPDRTLKTWDDITKINQYPFWRIAGVKGMEFAPNMGTWLIYRQGKLETAPSLDGNDYNYGTIDNLPSVHSKKLTYKHIRKIDFRGGQMVFDYPRAGLLGSISILNQVGDTIKKIRFEQDYVDSHGEEDDYWRRLWSVRSGDELYTFDYSFMVGGGSDYITDYWGYKLLRRHYGREANVVRHNARVSRGEGVFSFVRGGGSDNAPSAPPDTAITIGHIDPTEVFAYDGTPLMFLKIGYPTGGSAEFQMGQHRYRSKYGNKEPKGAGGYRIERIRYRDSDSKLLREKIYRYGPDEDGCGHVKYEPYFDEDYWGETRRSAVTEQQVNYYYEQVLPDGSIEPETFLYSVRKRTYLMGSNQSLSFESGSTVHYDEVAEYEMDGGRMSGKTVYKYDGGSMPTIHSTPLYPYPLEPEQWYLAPLDSVIRYEYRDGRYEWVQREKYVYNKYLDSTLIYRCRVWSPLEAEFQTNVTGRDFEQWKFDKVKGSLQFSVSGLHTGCLQLVTKEVQTRDAQGRVSTDRTRYRYDSPNCYAVGRIERTMSDGTTLVEQTLYPRGLRSLGRRNARRAGRAEHRFGPRRAHPAARRAGRLGRAVRLRRVRQSDLAEPAGEGRSLRKPVPPVEQVLGRSVRSRSGPRRILAGCGLRRNSLDTLRRLRQSDRNHRPHGSPLGLLPVGIQRFASGGRTRRLLVWRTDIRRQPAYDSHDDRIGYAFFGIPERAGIPVQVPLSELGPHLDLHLPSARGHAFGHRSPRLHHILRVRPLRPAPLDSLLRRYTEKNVEIL